MIKIRREYYVNLKGCDYPTWAGVLVALHENGLLGIEVTALQHPSEDNGWMAICQATVTMRGEDGRELIYTEIGDASPRNCSPQIALASLRMAATRAKGRAGRDALALGETLREEMPDGDDVQQNGHQSAPQSAQQGQRAKHDPADTAERKAAQGSADGLCEECGMPVMPAVAKASRERFGAVLCSAHIQARRQPANGTPAQVQGA